MSKRLIINADDYGWDNDAVNGILSLCNNNCISSTSILATHATDSDLLNIKSVSSVSKGLHINLIDGKPLSKNVTTLVDETGDFLSAEQLLIKLLSGRVKLSEIEIEIVAQLNRLRDAGIEVSHADSHRHIHLYPVLGNIILPLLKKNGIKKIRTIKQNRMDDKRRLIIKLFSLFPNYTKSSFKKPELLLCDFSMGEEIDENLFNESIKKAFTEYSTIEFMTHPALADRHGSYQKRKKEFQFLSSGIWKKFLVNEDIQLISYNEL